jgi:hypothetical protein
MIDFMQWSVKTIMDGINWSIPGNYTLLSNLNTVSTLMERLILVQLIPYVLAPENFSPLRSVYHTGH